MDLSKPVTLSTIFGAIALIFFFIAIGLIVVRYYKKKRVRRVDEIKRCSKAK